MLIGKERILSGLLLLSLPGLVGASSTLDDEYLKLIESEARKLELLEGQEAGSSSPAGTEEAPPVERSEQARFEAELKKHKGTYSFYRKLEDKGRAEVFKAWKEGASFAEVRRLIVNRRMHR